MKERLLNLSSEIIEAMEYFKSFIENIPDDKLDYNPKFYNIETDLVIFKNKFKKNDKI